MSSIVKKKKKLRRFVFLSEIEGLYENSRGEKKKVKKKERKREGD